MAAWGDLLAGFDVVTLGPRPVPGGLGSASPADALATTGGPPTTAPDTPLLVAVNDPARATNTPPALAAVRAAVGSRPLRVVVATGSHQFTDDVRLLHEEPLRAAAGAPSEFRWHDARDGAHVAVGDALVDAWLAAARDVVGIGSVEPHWFAGLTGAHKTLTIGLLALDDIAANHRRALERGSAPLRLAGNPVFEGVADVLAAVARDRHVVALQHLADRWFAGAPLACLDACAAAARDRRSPGPLSLE